MASKTTATTVTLKHLAANLAEDNELSKKQAEAILGGLVGDIVKHLKKGERIRIGGLGILQVRKRAARMGRNPATGEPIQIKASKKVAFRASKELKEFDLIATHSQARGSAGRRCLSPACRCTESCRAAGVFLELPLSDARHEAWNCLAKS